MYPLPWLRKFSQMKIAASFPRSYIRIEDGDLHTDHIRNLIRFYRENFSKCNRKGNSVLALLTWISCCAAIRELYTLWMILSRQKRCRNLVFPVRTPGFTIEKTIVEDMKNEAKINEE